MKKDYETPLIFMQALGADNFITLSGPDPVGDPDELLFNDSFD